MLLAISTQNSLLGPFKTGFVYFNPCLGPAHSERWSKYAFSTFLSKKAEKGRKSKKFDAKFRKKLFFFSLHQNAG